MNANQKFRTLLLFVVLVMFAMRQSPAAYSQISLTGSNYPGRISTNLYGTNLIIGQYSNGTMDVAGGQQVNIYRADSFLGNVASATGTARIAGAGSRFTNEFSLYAGWNGTGILNVDDGGYASASGMFFGRNVRSSGELNVTNGGDVANNITYLGYGTSTLASATISDAGSSLTTNGTLHVGYGAGSTGNLDIGNGGVVTSYAASVAYNSSGFTGSSVRVHGAGSQWNVSNTVEVGRSGLGSVDVSAGGAVTSGSISLGGRTGSYGIGTVNGEGARWSTNQSISVGSSGRGALTISNGGNVSSTYSAFIGSSSPATGDVSVSGIDSKWDIGDSLYIGGNSSSAGGTGTLTIQDSGTVSAGDLLKVWGDGEINLQDGTLSAKTLDLTAAEAEFNMTGGILDAENVLGNLVQNGGLIGPGNSPGTTSISGDYTINSGTLEIELAGTDQGSQYDLLDIDGLAQLNGGELEISLRSSFESSILSTDTFTVLTADFGLEGEFSGLADGARLETADGLGSFTIIYASNGVVLSNFIASVPEPSSAALLAMTLSVVSLRRRKCTV